jgi:hypothetical protein
MNRRELLKRAAVVPVAALGAAMVSGPAEAGTAIIGTVVDVFVGGYGPESLNGGNVVIKLVEGEGPGVLGEKETTTVLVHKKTAIFFLTEKVKYREFLAETYYNHEEVKKALVGTTCIASFPGQINGGKAKKVDFNVPLPA